MYDGGSATLKFAGSNLQSNFPLESLQITGDKKGKGAHVRQQARKLGSCENHLQNLKQSLSDSLTDSDKERLPV